MMVDERAEWEGLMTADLTGLSRDALIASVRYLAERLLSRDRVVKAAKAYVDSDPPRPEFSELINSLEALEI